MNRLRCPHRLQFLSWLLLVAGLLAGACVPALAGVKVAVGHFERDGLALDDVSMMLEDVMTASTSAHITGKLVLPALGWRDVPFDLDGMLERSDSHWRFDGTLKLRDAPGKALRDARVVLSLDRASGDMKVTIDDGKAHVGVELTSAGQGQRIVVALKHVPLAWLQGSARTLAAATIKSGTVSGNGMLQVDNAGVRGSLDLAVSDVGFSARGGQWAGQGIDLSGTVGVDSGRGSIDADLVSHGGQWLFGSWFVNLDDRDITLRIDATHDDEGTRIRKLVADDPNVGQLAGKAVLGADGTLQSLDITQLAIDLAPAYAYYGKVWLSTLGYDDLSVGGYLQAQVHMDARGLSSFRLQTAAGRFVAPGKFGIRGLRGALVWSRNGTDAATTLGWKGLSLYRIHLGAASGQWQNRDGKLTLLAPLQLPLLGGDLVVSDLAWDPGKQKGERLRTSLAVTGVDMARLCTVLGWPKFPGTLAGGIPGLRYVDNRITLDGGLFINVFGGFVGATNLALRHPFGDAPVLTGNINISQLDLADLTSVFDIGRVTGKLDGSVDNLALVNWKPVSFDAQLATSGKGRISQRAVENLTSVGGGIGTSLQGLALRLFDSFGYSHIALSCKLRGAVCTMGGIKPADDGYLIVEGRGLPHLTIVGHQRRVDWPTLVQRIRDAIESGGPVVQ